MSDYEPIRKMLEKYDCRTNEQRRNALKEIVQELAILGLSRTGFFSRAAFYGGTALRMFHGLDRFSEDLDFSLDKSDPSFSLDSYLAAVRDELGSWGFAMSVERKEKKAEGAVQSAFIKGGTLEHLVRIASITPPVSGIAPDEVLKIKIEIDTDPPEHAGFEIKYRLNPIPFSVRLYDTPSLFAGKVHALVCREWKARVKGRDFYDYIWYLQNGSELNIRHLESRMRQSGHWHSDEMLSKDALFGILEKRFSSVDYAQAKEDMIPFLKDTRSIDVWSADFFISVTRDMLKTTRNDSSR